LREQSRAQKLYAVRSAMVDGEILNERLPEGNGSFSEALDRFLVQLYGHTRSRLSLSFVEK
jgi:hypothetical protein